MANREVSDNSSSGGGTTSGFDPELTDQLSYSSGSWGTTQSIDVQYE